jgi:hypothetical protein
VWKCQNAISCNSNRKIPFVKNWTHLIKRMDPSTRMLHFENRSTKCVPLLPWVTTRVAAYCCYQLHQDLHVQRPFTRLPLCHVHSYAALCTLYASAGVRLYVDLEVQMSGYCWCHREGSEGGSQRMTVHCDIGVGGDWWWKVQSNGTAELRIWSCTTVHNCRWWTRGCAMGSRGWGLELRIEGSQGEDDGVGGMMTS